MTARVYDNWFKEWDFKYGEKTGPHASTHSPDGKVCVTVTSWGEVTMSVTLDDPDKTFEVTWPFDELDDLKVMFGLVLSKLNYDGVLTHLQIEMSIAFVRKKLSSAKSFRYVEEC
jgi:hypothetical protein